MRLPDDVALDYAIVKASLILISTLAIFIYLILIAVKITSKKSAALQVPRTAIPKPPVLRRKTTSSLSGIQRPG